MGLPSSVRHFDRQFFDTNDNRYNTAFQLKKKQDDYCGKALNGEWHGLGEFPEDLQWEALVDVVRGRVKVSCC